MLFSLFLLGFLGAATYMQAIQGLTSAAITSFLAVISTVTAFATYEYIAEQFLMGMSPEYAHALALAGMFTVPLVVLRLLTDMWITRTNLLPQLIDRGIAGVFGFFSALLTTGIIACSIQMLPWGVTASDDGQGTGTMEVKGGFFGFRRFDPLKPTDPQSELWLKPDRVVVSFARLMSTNTFSSNNPEDQLANAEPDLVTELGLIHSLPLGVRRIMKPEDVKVVDAGQLNYLYEVTFGQMSGQEQVTPIDPEQGKTQFMRVSLELSGEINDVDDKARYSPEAVRIVGQLGSERIIIPATAVLDPDDPSRYIVRYKKGNRDLTPVAGKVLKIPATKRVEVAFEVPDGFKPDEIRFKKGGNVTLTKSQRAQLMGEEVSDAQVSNPKPVNNATQTASSKSGGASKSSGGGRVSGVTFRSSRFASDLPMTFTAFQQVDAEIQSGSLKQGLLTGKVADQGSVKSGDPVSQLEVPSGKALLQLNVESLNAGSLLGKALNHSVKTVENYSIEDDKGTKILACGKYAVAKVGGEVYVELSYYPTFESGGGRYRQFSKIKNQHLKKDYQLVYLFLVDKGRQAVKFSTGGNKRTIDLRKEKLIAR